jgi:hypothetical protein
MSAANMSASIMRSIVSSVFKVNPRKVVLAGEISPEFVPQNNCGHSWWSGAEELHHSIWGFDPQKGINELKITREYQFFDNGESIHTKGEKLSEYLERTEEEYLFFIVKEWGKPYGDNQEKYEIWTLYKSPEFKKYFQSLNSEDISRWEAWIAS